MNKPIMMIANSSFNLMHIKGFLFSKFFNLRIEFRRRWLQVIRQIFGKFITAIFQLNTSVASLLQLRRLKFNFFAQGF